MNHWFGDEWSMFVIVEPRKPFNKRRMEGYFVLKIGKFGKGYRNGGSRRVAVNRNEAFEPPFWRFNGRFFVAVSGEGNE